MNNPIANTQEEIKRLCKTLRLPGVAQEIDELLSNPENLNLSQLEWMGRALRREDSGRNTRSLDRRLKNAQLRHKDALVSKIEYKPTRGLDKKVLNSMATCDWIRASQNCLIVGKAGVGKTWIASALGNSACCAGMNVKMVRMPLLLDEIRATELTQTSIPEFINRYAKFNLLILDDWGLGKLDPRCKGHLVELIEARSGKASTLVTKVLPVNCWSDYIADATFADAFMDRFLQNVIRIEVKGPSMRTGVK